MIWLLGGYMWLFVHRPFEVWPWLGDLQIERAYMLLMITYWVVQPNKGWLPNRIHLALAIFTLVLTAAWLASPFMDAPGCAEGVENYYKLIVFYILVVTSVRDESGLRKLALMFLGAVGLYMSHSLLEYFNGRCVYHMDVRRMVGVDSSFNDPNAFAAGLVCALPMTLAFWAAKPSLWMKGMLAGGTAVACLCILLTGSRSGFMGLGLCILLCLAATGRFKTALALLVLFAVTAPIAWFALPEQLQNRYLTIIDPSFGPKNAQASADGRIDGLVLGYEAWTQSPVIGYGPGAFKYAMHRDIQAHNLYGQVISELGTLGALALVGLLACFVINWREARRLRREDAEQGRTFSYDVTRSVMVGLVMLLFFGMSGHNLLRYHWVWFAAFQAVALHCMRRRAALAEAPAPLWETAPGEPEPAAVAGALS